MDEDDSTYERMLKLETWLSQMEYSRTLGSLPERIDSAEEFLEYFLFEHPVGHCSYFATAFVLLARAEGIPARYVQGFYVTDQKKNLMVTSDMAHAWHEVYIDGIGWIAFEPTPGYKYTFSWNTYTEKQSMLSEPEVPELPNNSSENGID